jgi:signal transduction histidine kinase
MKALTFLIADDFPGNLKLLRAGLESEGHQVIEAANGAEALAVLELESVDAVISDILMPSMDGFRLCSEIRRSTKSYREIPIILYTATYDSPADRALADSVGADAYMLKPAPAAALIAAVQDVRHNTTRRAKATSVADETDVLKHYNAALVHKLETRSNEVQDSLVELQSAHRQIIEMNRLLEARVAQRTAALDAVNKELEAFAFSVSHDLQAPLRRISGFTELLKDSVSFSIDGSNREMLGHVIDASTQMSQLIDALLAFARTSRTEMHFGEVDLDILADEVIADLHVSSGRIIEWRRTPLPGVRGDEILLRQVLVNLLSNAVKFTRTRDRAVIEIGASDGHNNEAVISISDNGVGFDMRYADKLFGVFQRMHRADEFEGTGIGLANAQRIVTRHGGSIWANASLGSGATFCVSLPRSQEPPRDPASERAAAVCSPAD